MARPKNRIPKQAESHPSPAQELIAVLEEQRNSALNAYAMERAAFAAYRKQNPPTAAEPTANGETPVP